MARILVVDDDRPLMDLLENVFEMAGYDVVTALNGAGCYAHLTQKPLPDLITLDCRLPDIPGAAILRAVRARSDLRHIPVLIVTASPEDMADVPAELYQGLLVKPFSLAELLRLVEQHTRNTEELMSYDPC